MHSAFMKNVLAEIKTNFGRFMSIMAIVALGVSFFAGIKASAPDMKHSADTYFDQYNLQDIQVFSTLGLYEEDINEIRQMKGVEAAEGLFTIDTVTNLKTSQLVIKVFSYDYNGQINRVRLISGRLPEKDNECLIEAASATSNMFGSFEIGNTITLASGTEEDLGEKLKYTTYTIVGSCYIPTYLSYEKGSSDIGSGTVDSFIVIPQSAVLADYYTEIDVTITGAKEIDCYSDEYFDLIDPVRERIDLLESHSTKDRISEYQREIDEAKREYRYQIDDGQKQLDEAKEKIDAGQKELDASEQQLLEAEKEIREGEAEIARNEQILADAKRQLDEGWAQYYDGLNSAQELVDLLAEIARIEASQATLPLLQTAASNTQTSLNNAQLTVDSLQANCQQLENQIAEADRDIASLNQQITAIDQQLSDPALTAEQISQLNNQKTQLQSQLASRQAVREVLQQQLDSQRNSLQLAIENRDELQQQLNDINNQISQINDDTARLDDLRAQRDAYLASAPELLAAYNQLTEAQQQYDEGLTQLQAAKIQLADAKSQVQQGRRKFNEGKAELENARQQYRQALAEFEEKKADGLRQIEENQNQIDSLKAEWYVLDRNYHYSYRDYEACADRMDGIASVFPVFFFLVAALICTTTMTRMVDEQRTEIGTLKALGYSKIHIASKYIIYALIASICGCLIGCILGMLIFPYVIFSAWNTLYNLQSIYFTFPPGLMALASLSMIASTVLVTILTIYGELNDVPSQLMRPKSNKAGKKILLERLDFIWKPLSFLSKVTLRNLFRYKKRFFMTVIGIAGCSALILAGFGINDSISDIARAQYEDIYHYDASISVKKASPELMQHIYDLNGVNAIYQEQQLPVTVEHKNKDMSVTVHIVNDVETFEKFTTLYVSGSHQPLHLDDEGAMISQKLANQLEVGIGDTITFTDSDENEISVTISGIFENYVFHHIYVTEEQYNRWKTLAKITDIYEIQNRSKDSEFETQLGNQIMALEGVSGITFYSSLQANFADMIHSISFIVVVLVISAAALAAVVLYNLSNVNISERIREIATIKVLGFTDTEVDHYVNRESIIMTVIGALAGLLVGVYLHDLIMNLAELDEVMFGRNINTISFFISFFMTLAFSLIVNGLMHFKLKKIQMVESLKAVE